GARGPPPRGGRGDVRAPRRALDRTPRLSHALLATPENTTERAAFEHGALREVPTGGSLRRRAAPAHLGARGGAPPRARPTRHGVAAERTLVRPRRGRRAGRG